MNFGGNEIKFDLLETKIEVLKIKLERFTFAWSNKVVYWKKI